MGEDQMSETTSARVDCCPECKASGIEVVAASSIQRDGTLPRHRCGDCGARFDEVDRRPDEHPVRSRCGLAKKLADADSLDDLRGETDE